MAYDEQLAARIRTLLDSQAGLSERKMFGGLAFLLNGNMCCGLTKSDMMARVGPQQHAAALALPYARAMEFTGRPMTGMVFVEPPGVASDADLQGWVDRCVAFTAALPAKAPSGSGAKSRRPRSESARRGNAGAGARAEWRFG